MRDYATSLGIGLAVGVVYGWLRFRSPAPPLIALVGLLGMLAGEQAVSLLRRPFAPRSLAPPAAADSKPPKQTPTPGDP